MLFVLLVVLLLIPGLQVMVIRFVNPPRTLPMLLEEGGPSFRASRILRSAIIGSILVRCQRYS
jgi:hypothetical protein